MIRLGEDELICDLAEVYSIYDYKSYPVKLIATLAVGLGLNSRIKSKQMELPVGLDTILLATISDNLSNYMWYLSGCKGDPPGTFVKRLLNEEEPQEEGKYKSFSDEDELLQTLYKGDKRWQPI